MKKKIVATTLCVHTSVSAINITRIILTHEIKKQIYLRKKMNGMAWNRQTHKYELKDKFIVFISCTVRKRPTKATKKMKENNNI